MYLLASPALCRRFYNMSSGVLLSSQNYPHGRCPAVHTRGDNRGKVRSHWIRHKKVGDRNFHSHSLPGKCQVYLKSQKTLV